jgi:hypothetical protein
MSYREAAEDFREKMLRWRYKDQPEKLEEELAKLREKRKKEEQRHQQVATEKEAEEHALQGMTLDELELLRRKTERELEAMKGSLEHQRKVLSTDEAADSLVGQLGKLFLNNPLMSEGAIREELHYLDKIEIAIKSKQTKPEASPQPPTREEERARNYTEARAKWEAVGKNRDEELQRMRSAGESTEKIKRIENMWDDAERQAEEEMRRYMV